eukprot:8868200-Lingulodinium_polyedra.AAC.1
MKADFKSPKATSLWRLEAAKRNSMIEVVCGVGLARSSSRRSGSLKPTTHQRHFAVAQDPTPSPG